MANDKLPGDLLLEIFDTYRRDMELQPQYEDIWKRGDGSDGWLKLAHVCLYWRRVVFLSPSRLDVYLLITLRKFSKESESMLRCLPSIPIWFDYSAPPCLAPAQLEKQVNLNLVLAIMEHRGRVRGISLRACQSRFFRELSQPFPELKSFEIVHGSTPDFDVILPATFLSSFALSLRQITLQGVTSGSLFPLLSSAIGLVELSLTHRIGPKTPRATSESLLANLQCIMRMPCLRRLKLKWSYHETATLPPPLPASVLAGDIIPLSKLTDFIFEGPCPYLHMFVARLAVPSLKHLDAKIFRGLPAYAAYPSIPPLCNWICETESQFIAVHFHYAPWPWSIDLSAETSPKSDHARPFRICFSKDVALLEQIGTMLSEPLSTVEKVYVERQEKRSPLRLGIPWHTFFKYLRQVKMVQLSCEEAIDVAHSFEQGGLLDLFPTLEQIKVTGRKRNSRYINPFKPLIAARQQVGRPVALSWVSLMG